MPKKSSIIPCAARIRAEYNFPDPRWAAAANKKYLYDSEKRFQSGIERWHQNSIALLAYFRKYAKSTGGQVTLTMSRFNGTDWVDIQTITVT